MFDGGKKSSPPPEAAAPTPEVIDHSVRVFAMPEELRTKAATLEDVLKKEAPPEALAPLIIPVVVPAEPAPVVIKKRVSPALMALFVLVLMGGTGAGVWWYVITYATPPQIVQEPSPEPIVEPDPEPTEPYPGTDTDSDGLTNVEELLYGTDFRSPDTDGDTFLDGNEVFHRYDPNGLAPSTLLDTGAVRVLERSNIPFTMYYPSSWSIDAESSSTTLAFRSSEGASITLVYEAKDTLVALKTWMKQNDISASNIEETMTKEGYEARVANEGRAMYIDLGAWVVSATYELGEENYSIDFLQTFKMMMNSVEEVAKDSPVSTQ
jgi:hypothetical protein